MMENIAKGFEYLTLAFLMLIIMNERTRIAFIEIITYNEITLYGFFYLTIMMVALSSAERIWRMTRKF